MQTNGGVCWKHTVCHPDEQRIAKSLPQSPQSMADSRLGQTEAFACCGEAAKIPNREKDTQQIKVEMVINLAHTENYYYEFDLVQAGRHRDVMAAHFNPASDPRKKISASKLSSAAGLSICRQFTDGYKEMWNE